MYFSRDPIPRRTTAVAILFLIILIGSHSAGISHPLDDTGDCEQEPPTPVSTSVRQRGTELIWSGERTISEDHVVEEDDVLVISPGSVISFDNGAGLIVKGTLLADGSPGEPVTFRPAVGAGSWKGIRFSNPSLPSENGSIVDHCVIVSAVCAVDVYGGNLSVSNATITDSREWELHLADAEVRLRNTPLETSLLSISDAGSRIYADWDLLIDLADPVPSGADTATVIIETRNGTECTRAEVPVPGSPGPIPLRGREYCNKTGAGICSLTHTSHRIIAYNRAGIVKQHRVYMDAPRHLDISFSASSSPSDMLREVNSLDLEATIHDLTDFGTRHVISPEKYDAADYIFGRFRELSAELLEEEVTDPFNSQTLDVSYGNYSKNNFLLDNGTVVDRVDIINVVAELPGTNVSSDRRFVVSAHYDTHALDVPGADDDASGIAGILEVARIMSQYRFEDTVIFVAFDSEEEDYLGSENYVRDAWQRVDNIVGDLQLDMIGYNNDSGYHCVVWHDNRSEWLGDLLEDVNARYSIGLDLRVYNDQHHRNSDHRNFWNFGYPAVEIIEHEDVRNWNPYYHTANDTIDTINFTEANKITQLTLAGAVEAVVVANSAPSPPVILFPDESHDLAPTVKWLPSVDLDGDDVTYTVLIGTTPGGDELYSGTDMRETEIPIGEGNLSFGGRYYLEMYALDETGRPSTTVEHSWSVVNHPPVLAGIGDIQATEDVLLSLNISATDADTDPVDDLVYGDNSHLFDVHPVTGVVRWLPGNGDVGIHRINFTVSDGKGGLDFEEVHISVVNVNDPPVLTKTAGDIELPEDTVMTGALELTDHFEDIDGDHLSYNCTGSDKVRPEIRFDGMVEITSERDWFGRETLTFHAADPGGGTANMTVNVTVLPVNDPPVLKNIDDMTVREGEIVVIEPNATDVDTAVLHFAFGGAMTGTIWETGYEDAGVHTVNVTVFDGEGRDSQTVYITVIDVNRDPVAMAGRDRTAKAGEAVLFDASGSFDPDDPDNAERDEMSYTWDFGDGSAGHSMTVTHSYRNAGTYRVMLIVEDGNGGTGTYELVVLVEEITDDSSLLSGWLTWSIISIVLVCAVIVLMILLMRRKRGQEGDLSKMWGEPGGDMTGDERGEGEKEDMIDDVRISDEHPSDEMDSEEGGGVNGNDGSREGDDGAGGDDKNGSPLVSISPDDSNPDTKDVKVASEGNANL